MILFGVEMDEDLFSGTQDDISSKAHIFETTIRNMAGDLASALHTDAFEATAVRSIILQGGTIKGVLSLPHCAAEAGLGRIGDNRLLISPRCGSRIGLGGVVTSRDIEETPRRESAGEPCNHCKKCMRACPEHALTPGNLDLFKCRNVTGSVSGRMRPVIFRFIRSGEHLPFSNRLLNFLASGKINACAYCLVSCPHFYKKPSDSES
jgi:epoxyqueuosine reductase QueG